MSLLGGRGGRSDDWSTPHLRARARAAERLDDPLEPAEEAWLDEHLADCLECTATAADYAGQRLELRALRDRPPVPPRDLWARTAAAIEREAMPVSRRRWRPVRSLATPYALLAGALVVAVAVGSLSLSQFNRPAGTPATTPTVALGGGQPTAAAATPILVDPGSVAYLTQTDGNLQLNHLGFTHVCGPTTPGCETADPKDSRPIGPVASPDSVFGASAGDRPLVVVSNGNGSGGKVYAVAVATQQPEITPTPSPSTSPTVSSSAATNPTPSATASSGPAKTPKPSPSAPPSPPASSTPTSEPALPSPSESALPATVVEIARDLKVLDTTAAYAPDGSAFAFTARPADDSHGPDIYLWHVGDPKASPITTDHRSIFGSWAGGSIVGSTVTASSNDRFDRPVAFLLARGATEPTLLPSTGLAWRPVVDPTGRVAVYWSGRLQATADGLDWTTSRGKLVIGRWDDVTAGAALPADTSPDATASAEPSPDATASAEPSPDATATAVNDADQPQARSETTIARGPLTDWDVRWDKTGTRLAVWIADPEDPTVGHLSLYVVDPFDGQIDRSRPPLVDEPALAGFSMADDHLAWAAPAAGSKESSVLVLAWTGDEFGKVESAPGDVILVR
jgi:hypothetical protein